MDEVLKIRVESPDPRTTFIRCEGEFAGMEVLGEEAKLLEAAAKPAGGNLVLDFSQVGYIDSAGVGIVYKLVKAAQEKGAKLSVLGANKDVKKIMTTAAVHKVATFI